MIDAQRQARLAAAGISLRMPERATDVPDLLERATRVPCGCSPASEPEFLGRALNGRGHRYHCRNCGRTVTRLVCA